METREVQGYCCFLFNSFPSLSCLTSLAEYSNRAHNSWAKTLEVVCSIPVRYARLFSSSFLPTYFRFNEQSVLKEIHLCFYGVKEKENPSCPAWDGRDWCMDGMGIRKSSLGVSIRRSLYEVHLYLKGAKLSTTVWSHKNDQIIWGRHSLKSKKILVQRLQVQNLVPARTFCCETYIKIYPYVCDL